MSVLRISRLSFLRNGRQPALLASYSDNASKKGESSDDDPTADKKEKQEKDDKRDKAADTKKEVSSQRLNDLLAMMSTDSNLSIVKDVIRPRSTAEKKKRHQELSSVSEGEAPKPESIAEAAKEVAETLGGDTKKTESELLEKLLKDETATQNLSSLLGGMQIDKERPPFERRSDVVRKSLGQRPVRDNQERRSDHVRKPSDHRPVHDHQEGMHSRMQRPRRDRREPQRQSDTRVNVNLFGAKPLGIFTNAADLQESVNVLPTWNSLQNRELNLAVTHPPRNYFEKMALWTEQGKLWKFPIDNEQGMDDEAQIYFTEHIFLEKHLESWCPKKGPVRHFMELVCVGLSKNPYYTVTQKKEHIEWYRDYFAEKKELLESVIIDSDTPKELKQ